MPLFQDAGDISCLKHMAQMRSRKVTDGITARLQVRIIVNTYCDVFFMNFCRFAFSASLDLDHWNVM